MPVVSLRTVESWRIAWYQGFLPWLDRVRSTAPLAEHPTIFVAPTLSDVRQARLLALEAGFDHMAIEFLTPSTLRDFLASSLRQTHRFPLREHLRLLLAAAAERETSPAAQAVAAAPDTLLRSIDLLEQAGWDFTEVGPEPVRALVAEYHRLVTACGFSLPYQCDRALHRLAQDRPCVIQDLCLLGFDAAQWHAWPVLSAATSCASSAEVHLRLPSQEGADLDALWIGTWEDAFGEAIPLADADAERDEPEDQTQFHIAADAISEAQIIVQQALTFLADPACQRLGILFPNRDAVYRRVAAELAERGLPHFDGVGHIAAGDFTTGDWKAWLEYQESPRLPALLRLLALSPRTATLFGIEPDRVLERLDRAFRATLLDDTATLAAWDSELAKGLTLLPTLPTSATLPDYLTAVAEAFHHLGWEERLIELRSKSEGLAAFLSVEITRRTFLRWLNDLFSSPREARCPEGNHPYGRIHLLPATQAGGQILTHIIFAACNEDEWASVPGSMGWLMEGDLVDLNQRVRQLNRRATREGRQGLGHEIVAPGHTLCLGPGDRRELADRDIAHAVSSARALAFVASISAAGSPQRLANPAAFFTTIFFQHHQSGLGSALLHAMQRQSQCWLDSSGLWTRPANSPHSQLSEVYRLRRDPTQPFGIYEFALAKPPRDLPRLAATSWDRVLKNPAGVWMLHFLGVGPEGETDDTPWNAAFGEWVHHWLRAVAPKQSEDPFVPVPTQAEIVQRVVEAADRFRARVCALTTPPEWWHAAWRQARQFALDFAAQIPVTPDYDRIATEWSLPKNTRLDCGRGTALAVTGRLDLLLSGPGDAWWIIDYKTGKADAVRAEKIAGGDGLQLALYALALHAPDPARVGMSRLSRTTTLTEPQAWLDKLDPTAMPDFWQGLAILGSSGIFGMLGSLREEFTYSEDYPLATLGIDAEVLEAKWLLTHPLLAAPTA